MLGDEQYARPIRSATRLLGKDDLYISFDPSDISYKCIGALFTGGEDVCPRMYGEEPTPMCGHYNEERDKQETSLYIELAMTGIPCFGICRGSQLLYVLQGGKLNQHIEGHAISGLHDVIKVGTKTRFPVTSTHHQSAKYPLPRYTEMMLYSLESDGSAVIEGWRNTETNTYCVQYHPEYMESDSAGYRFFEDLVAEVIDDHLNR